MKVVRLPAVLPPALPANPTKVMKAKWIVAGKYMNAKHNVYSMVKTSQCKKAQSMWCIRARATSEAAAAARAAAARAAASADASALLAAQAATAGAVVPSAGRRWRRGLLAR